MCYSTSIMEQMKNAIFIIGAGSSKEYGYPIWKELKPKIEEYLNLPQQVQTPFALEAKEWLKEVTDHKTLDQVISEKNKGLRKTQDPSKVEAMIWKAIASIFFSLEKDVVSENRSAWIDVYANNIVSEMVQSYKAEDKDWYNKIMAELTNQLGDVYFVTFNYDRLLEYKVKEAIINKIKADINNENEFGLKLDTQIKAIFYDRFYHPHGIINAYDGIQDNSKITKNRNPNNISHFGQANESLLQYSPGLMASCFDCTTDTGSFLDIKNKKMTPEKIYILGNSPYGLENNLKKLPCKEWAESVKKIVCTSFTEGDQKTYLQIIAAAFEKDVEVVFYKTCSDFIEKEVI
jgi:hypothetical protein